MHDPRDFKVELSGSPQPEAEPAKPVPRPYLSVHFACCNVYLRIYRSADGIEYRGRCPRCGRSVSFAIGEGGTDTRAFVVR